MTGTFDKTTDTKAQNEAAILNIYATGNLTQYQPYFTAFYQFLMQMAYQHTTAYDILLGITDVTAEFTIVKNNATGTTEETRRIQSMSMALDKYYGMGGLNFASVAEAQKAAVTA
jgi:hypothetical protein